MSSKKNQKPGNSKPVSKPEKGRVELGRDIDWSYKKGGSNKADKGIVYETKPAAPAPKPTPDEGSSTSGE